MDSIFRSTYRVIIVVVVVGHGVKVVQEVARPLVADCTPAFRALDRQGGREKDKRAKTTTAVVCVCVHKDRCERVCVSTDHAMEGGDASVPLPHRRASSVEHPRVAVNPTGVLHVPVPSVNA